MNFIWGLIIGLLVGALTAFVYMAWQLIRLMGEQEQEELERILWKRK